MAALGNKRQRETKLAAVLYTAAAFGVRINLKKGERGGISCKGDLEGMGGRWNGHGERPAIDDRKVVMDWRNTSTVTLDSERYVRHAEGR